MLCRVYEKLGVEKIRDLNVNKTPREYPVMGPERAAGVSVVYRRTHGAVVGSASLRSHPLHRHHGIQSGLHDSDRFWSNHHFKLCGESSAPGFVDSHTLTSGETISLDTDLAGHCSFGVDSDTGDVEGSGLGLKTKRIRHFETQS